MKPSSGEGQGLLASYFSSSDSTGLPVVSRVEPGVQNVSNPPAEFYAALGLPAPAAGGTFRSGRQPSSQQAPTPGPAHLLPAAARCAALPGLPVGPEA